MITANNFELEVASTKQVTRVTDQSYFAKHKLDPKRVNVEGILTDLTFNKFQGEIAKYEGMGTIVYVKDGRWQVPIEKRFKGWEFIEGIEEYVCTELQTEVELLED